MDKGIFYLVCSVVIILAVAVTGVTLNKQIVSSCGVKTVTVTKDVMVTPAVTVTATPSAAIKRATVLPVKPSGVVK